MDANCYGHSAVLLDIWRNHRTAVADDNAPLVEVTAMAKAFAALHENDPDSNKVKTVDDAKMSGDDTYPKGFEAFLDSVEDGLDPVDIEFAGLAFSSAQAVTCFYERLGTNYSYVDQPTFTSLPEEADPDSKNLVNHIWKMRARIAEISTSRLYAMTWNKTTAKYKAARPREYVPKNDSLQIQQWGAFEDQVAEALYFRHSQVTGNDGSKIMVEHVFSLDGSNPSKRVCCGRGYDRFRTTSRNGTDCQCL